MGLFDTNVEKTFFAGFIVFLVSSAGLLLFIISKLFMGEYLYLGLTKNENIRTKYKKDIARWDRFKWVVFGIFVISLLYSVMYAGLWLGQGLFIKLNGLIINWGRWLLVSFVALIFVYITTFIISDKSISKAHAFFATFWAVVVILSLLAATWSQTDETRILWLVFSIISALITGALLVFPVNMFLSHKEIHRKSIDPLIYSNMHTSSSITTTNGRQLGERQKSDLVKPKNSVYNFTRIIFFSVILFAYWCYLLIWLLSESNELINAINFDGEAIAYLVLDFILLIPIAIFLIIRVNVKISSDHFKKQ